MPLIIPTVVWAATLGIVVFNVLTKVVGPSLLTPWMSLESAFGVLFPILFFGAAIVGIACLTSLSRLWEGRSLTDVLLVLVGSIIGSHHAAFMSLAFEHCPELCGG